MLAKENIPVHLLLQKAHVRAKEKIFAEDGGFAKLPQISAASEAWWLGLRK